MVKLKLTKKIKRNISMKRKETFTLTQKKKDSIQDREMDRK